MESKRRHATAVVLLGVIGAEFGQDIEDRRKGGESRNRAPVEGFGLGANQNLARLTSKQDQLSSLFTHFKITPFYFQVKH